MRYLLRSLKLRLGLMAAGLGLAAVLSAGLLLAGLAEISARMQALEAAERRLDRYSVLSTEAARYLVVATEALQSGLGPQARSERLSGIAAEMAGTFARLQDDLRAAVAEAERLGLDEQSRRATTGLAIARMQAQFAVTHAALLAPGGAPETLRGYLDSFAMNADPNLNAAVSAEIRGREAIRAGIVQLRHRLSVAALALALTAAGLAAGAYLALIRPQIRRLDRLAVAARRIGAEDFAVALPEAPDEIGRLFAETNRMAAALGRRRAEIAADWARLNEIIDSRTEALRAANEALAARDRDRRRFFADISHELRTPLTVISMEAQIGAASPDPGQAAAFATIRARAERLSRQIDDLLRVARSESGQLELAPVPLDAGEILREALEAAQGELAAAGMDAALGPLAPAPVLADPAWLRQLATGAIRNAIRHAGAGGKLRLELEPGAETVLRITDNGPGIAPEARERLFDRFARGADSPGFGIGLALARWVMEEQGGRVEIESPVAPPRRLGDNPGCSLCLALPRLDDSPE
ncbi:HAMP domain-containing sensor histidine kinase [Poseidonocella sp. HB161398]|uniref:sensor histidine kinase n=1 Tax=Poseidonocella sp. HB161398 TaxID=2320855 RepID=UPI001109139B|nr:HAMP domain-containing sensor histidine kinase [Poseidonocella sp. HB161398]